MKQASVQSRMQRAVQLAAPHGAAAAQRSAGLAEARSSGHRSKPPGIQPCMSCSAFLADHLVLCSSEVLREHVTEQTPFAFDPFRSKMQPAVQHAVQPVKPVVSSSDLLHAPLRLPLDVSRTMITSIS